MHTMTYRATILVTGVGSSAAKVAYIRSKWRDPDGYVFDYNSRSKLVDAVNFLKNKRRGSFGDRVQRLAVFVAQIAAAYRNNVRILAHSHGALLVQRALEHLYALDPVGVSKFDVATYGPGQPVPVQSSTLRLRTAVNTININDFVQFVSSAFRKTLQLKNFPLGKEVCVQTGKAKTAKTYCIVVMPPAARGHRNYDWKDIVGV
jgi:hypothetical protein